MSRDFWIVLRMALILLGLAIVVYMAVGCTTITTRGAPSLVYEVFAFQRTLKIINGLAHDVDIEDRRIKPGARMDIPIRVFGSRVNIIVRAAVLQEGRIVGTAVYRGRFSQNTRERVWHITSYHKLRY